MRERQIDREKKREEVERVRVRERQRWRDDVRISIKLQNIAMWH